MHSFSLLFERKNARRPLVSFFELFTLWSLRNPLWAPSVMIGEPGSCRKVTTFYSCENVFVLHFAAYSLCYPYPSHVCVFLQTRINLKSREMLSDKRGIAFASFKFHRLCRFQYRSF